jgi:CarD family transcriptional regulator
MKQKLNFKVEEYVVYPTHGVGKIKDIVKEKIANFELECYIIEFEREKLTISIPMKQALKSGLRRLSTKKEMQEIFNILRGGIKKMKGMWSRRAQEYEEKINTGDLISIAEVLRDLTRDVEDSERSYSERVIYETALHRLSSEYASVEHISITESTEKIISISKDKIAFEEKKAANEG